MDITEISAAVNALDQAGLDTAIAEEVFGSAIPIAPFSKSHDLSLLVISKLYGDGMINSVDMAVKNMEPGLAHNCTFRRSFIGTEPSDVMSIEAGGDSQPTAICRAALILCRVAARA